MAEVAAARWSDRLVRDQEVGHPSTASPITARALCEPFQFFSGRAPLALRRWRAKGKKLWQTGLARPALAGRGRRLGFGLGPGPVRAASLNRACFSPPPHPHHRPPTFLLTDYASKHLASLSRRPPPYRSAPALAPTPRAQDRLLPIPSARIRAPTAASLIAALWLLPPSDDPPPTRARTSLPRLIEPAPTSGSSAIRAGPAHPLLFRNHHVASSPLSTHTGESRPCVSHVWMLATNQPRPRGASRCTCGLSSSWPASNVTEAPNAGRAASTAEMRSTSPALLLFSFYIIDGPSSLDRMPCHAPGRH
ncbi:uncharacterized protein PSFLO_02613 [Pseudozyma flocculosa]|uniref:Uncharacterized protein n=1 Tax=Pseudozyma flocculosa TaxID=84751 RepID=A0A5C3F1J2_9BASI|nr:uncharacterized protein PSFLO_02613 [Pseudozyma flocculosa]